MKASPLDIASYLIHISVKNERPLTNKKLQKLLYYAQAWSLVLRKQSLFDEPIEAWVHGPVVKSVYQKFKEFGFGIIQNQPPFDINSLSLDIREHLDEIWRVYGKYDAQYLEALSHSEPPWILARDSLDAETNSDSIISHESMESFYSALFKKAADQ